MISIPDDILKVKQEVEAEFFGTDPTWGRVETNVCIFSHLNNAISHFFTKMSYKPTFVLWLNTLSAHDFLLILSVNVVLVFNCSHLFQMIKALD